MTATLEKLLVDHGLNTVFEEKKEKMVFTMWDYINGYVDLTDTEPTEDTLRKFLHETIKYLPQVFDFTAITDTPKETKEDVVNYLVDKFYNYAMKQLETIGRGELEI